MVFSWNGRLLTSVAGDTIAIALWRHGIAEIGSSRKRHRSLGASGTYIQGVLVQVNGRPHVRADETLVEPGMDVREQNVWPTADINALSLLKFVPRRLLRSGFERPRLVPSGTRRFEWWERLLMFLAGEVSLSLDTVMDTDMPKGERWDGDVVVVGGGPEGRRQANASASNGLRVCLVSRSREPGSFAAAMGSHLPELNPMIKLLADHEANGVYRGGTVVLAVPKLPHEPPTVLVCKRLILSTGRRSVLPLISGHDLPGVLEARLALGWALALGAELGPAVVVGTGAQDAVGRALAANGVTIAAIGSVTDLSRIEGRRAVRAVKLNGATVRCRSLIHAGPWLADPALAFQAAQRGELRLIAGPLPERVSVVGSACLKADLTPLGSLESLVDVAVCSCMDVTVGDVLTHIRKGQTHIEVLKRSTSCGMGPCQGLPCWEHLSAVIRTATGASSEDHPTYRPPRRGITVAQAAVLDGLLELE
jgi:2Fe-2S iron-sulfur cluster binding domain/BFD-like [2Fe-2S] binding domain